MTLRETLAELKRCGTAQNRKVYARHGVERKMFGVSFAHLRGLARRIGTDHRLALSLWKNGNHDARMLALLVADPERLGRKELDDWARELDSYVVTDQFSALVGKSPHRRAKMEKWMRSKGEWTGRAGWLVLAGETLRSDELPDADLEDRLAVIENEIHGRRNRVRDAMNTALISIGLRSARLRRKAIATARRIGKVHVDHGETGCKTPDAESYIEKTLAHRARRNKVRGVPS